ncbi:Fosmidomycin resistance protein [Photorhabdus australis subsp. thailandensis]|uniref:Fosmidomycin resistance protein n=1 Tax=Photorhabdus australis subsp. thailandensis TaxID=2805096 RepID=A0A1C0U0U8_9GAMM|nr:Fosmidomycin resistance protein [Photorhabdus australis subsp. thailandensis]
MMSEQSNITTVPPHANKTRNTVFTILGAISVSHLLNDMIQSLILAIYPLLQSWYMHKSLFQVKPG